MQKMTFVHDRNLQKNEKKNNCNLYFRCNIPVIIMGETGCGKTRLIKFMCDLQVPAGADVQNMVLMKVNILVGNWKVAKDFKVTKISYQTSSF